jgi:peptidoglycan hydrolase CwlO-like protein
MKDRISNEQITTKSKLRVGKVTLWILLTVTASTAIFGALPMVFATQSPPRATSQPHTPIAQETLDAIENLNAEELVLLSELFETASRIDQLDAEMAVIQKDIDTLGGQIEEKQFQINESAMAYDAVRDTLGEILKSQQRAGAASNLEIVLNATSLKDLLRRLNLLRELSRKTDTLMQETQAARLRLEEEKAALSVLFAAQKAKEAELAVTLRSLVEAQTVLESQLQALASDRAFYEANLKKLDQSWSAFKPVFTESVTALSEMLESGDVPAGTIELEFSPSGVKGRITDDKFNAAVSQRQDLPELRFDFTKKGVLMTFVMEKAELQGYFEIVEERLLAFKVENGTFQGVSMSKAALEDLVSRGTLTFDLSGTLGKSTLRQITHEDGAIALTIDIKLF